MHVKVIDMKGKKHLNIRTWFFFLIIIIVIGMFAGSLISAEIESRDTEIIKSEFIKACEERLGEIYSQECCIRYGLTDIKFEIIDCVKTRYGLFDKNEYYLVSLRVDCTTTDEIDKTERALVGYDVINCLPEDFLSSTDNNVSMNVKSYEHEYAYLEEMVYLYVNEELTFSPELAGELITSEGITCPNCGTAFRYGTAGARMISEYRHCNICNGRGMEN